MTFTDLFLLTAAALAALTAGVIGWIWAGTLSGPNREPPLEDEPAPLPVRPRYRRPLDRDWDGFLAELSTKERAR